MQVGDDDRHPPEVVGALQVAVVRAVLLVHREDHLLHRGVARLDDVAGTAGGSAGSSSGRATTKAKPPVPRPLSSAEALSSTRSPTRGSPTIAV